MMTVVEPTGGKRFLSDEISYDQHINGIIKLLEQIAEKQRQCK